MPDRTVTVVTTDHGPITIPEPSWCTGVQHTDDVERADIAHTGPSINVMVGTEDGPRRLFELLLWQDPFPTPACTHSDDVYVVAELLDGHPGYDVPGLEALATDLLEAAAKVRRLARRLSVEIRGGVL